MNIRGGAAIFMALVMATTLVGMEENDDENQHLVAQKKASCLSKLYVCWKNPLYAINKDATEEDMQAALREVALMSEGDKKSSCAMRITYVGALLAVPTAISTPLFILADLSSSVALGVPLGITSLGALLMCVGMVAEKCFGENC